MNALWMLVVLVQVPVEPKRECRTSGMKVACGFDCRAELDDVKCAQTPQGFCQRLERQLVCWDPPEEVRLHAPLLGRPACRAKFRDLACGYTCVTSPNHLACAQTPWGVCATRFDRVECWDPSPAVIHHSKPEELTGAKCVQTDLRFACGWDCKRSYRDAQCTDAEGTVSHRGRSNQLLRSPLPPITHEPVATTKR